MPDRTAKIAKDAKGGGKCSNDLSDRLALLASSHEDF